MSQERNVLKEQLAEAAAALRERLGGRAPEVGLILGSGLGPLAERIEDAFDELEVDAQRGDQPLYPMVLSLE